MEARTTVWMVEHDPCRSCASLELGENFGFAEGYNRALAQIDAEVYVLLNSDVRIVESWIEPTLSAMDAQGWDVASPLIAQDVNPDLCEHAGAAGGFMDRDGFPFCAGRMFDSVEPVDEWLARDREVFWASGACFFIRKQEIDLRGRKPRSQDWLRRSRVLRPTRSRRSPTWKKSICVGALKTRVTKLAARTASSMCDCFRVK